MNNQRPYVTRWTFFGAARAAEKYMRALETGGTYRLSPRSLTCIARVQRLLLDFMLWYENQAKDKPLAPESPTVRKQFIPVLNGLLSKRLNRPIAEAETLNAFRTVCITGNELPLMAGGNALSIPYQSAELYAAFLHAYGSRTKEPKGRRKRSQKKPPPVLSLVANPLPLPDVRLDSVLLLAPIDDSHPARRHEINDRFDYQVNILIERGYHDAIGQTEEDFKDALEPLRRLILARGAHVNGRVPFLIVPHGDLGLRKLMHMVEITPPARKKKKKKAERTKGEPLLDETAASNLPSRRTKGRLRLDEKYVRDLPSLGIPTAPYLLLDVAHGAGVRDMEHKTYLRLLWSHGRSPLTAREIMLYLIQHETKLDFYKFLVAGSDYKAMYHPYVLYSGSTRRRAPPCAEMKFTSAEGAGRWLPAPEDWEEHVSDRITHVAKLSRAIPSCAGRIAA